MITWGLGIEHEIKCMFQQKKEGFNYYIDSRLIHFLFKAQEVMFYQHYRKFSSKNSVSPEYEKKMKHKMNLRKRSMLKEDFPFENPEIFKIEEQTFMNKFYYSISNETLIYIEFYIQNFILHHQPELFFILKSGNNTYYELEREINLYKHQEFTTKKECMYTYYLIIKKLLGGDYQKEYASKVIKTITKKNLRFTTMLDMYTIELNKEENPIDIILFTKMKARKIIDVMEKAILFPSDSKFVDTVFTLYEYNLPEIDFSASDYVLEFKTIEFKNKNYQTTLDDIMNYEYTFFKMMTNIFSTLGYKSFGQVNYDSIGSREEGYNLIDIFDEKPINNILDFYDYTGSYHLWITIPYEPNMSNTMFLNLHANLANQLQLLEPLIACNFCSPSFDIQYNKNYPSKLSLRHFMNRYSNYGTSDVSLVNGSEYTNINHVFFNNKKNPEIYNVNLPQKKIVNQNDTLIKNYNALSGRGSSNNIFQFIEYRKKLNSNNVFIKSFYELLLKKKDKSFEKAFRMYQEDHIQLGSDIRTAMNQDLIYPLSKKYDKIYTPKKNKYELFYINTVNGDITSKRHYDRESYKELLKDKRIGIEFRIFDHFPTQYMNQILCILPYLIMEAMDNKPIKSIHDTFVSKQFWHNEMFQVIQDGYHHKFSGAYTRQINKEFTIHCKEKKSSNELLENLYNELKEKYKSSKKKVLKKLIIEKPVRFISINEIASKIILKKKGKIK